MTKYDAPPVESLTFDPHEGGYIAKFDNSAVSPSTAVVSVVSEITENSATDIPPLYDVIEPDALDQIVSEQPSGRYCSEISVEFVYLAHTIHVTSSGVIKANPPDTQDDNVKTNS